MNTQHTPGPWHYETTTYVVTSLHPDWKFSLICKIATGEDRKQEDANARLIAAAPDLLEACKAVSRLDYLNEHNVLAKKVHDAIAKAEGR